MPGMMDDIGAALPAILDHVDDGITVRDAGGRLVYANAAAARFLGFDTPDALLASPPEEFLARFEIFAAEGTPFSPALVPGRVAIEGKIEPAVELCFRVRTTGEERWAEVRARQVDDSIGRPQLVVSVWRDITARRRAEERNRALAAIVTTSDDAIVTKTLNGTVTSWNPAAERLYGWTADEMVGGPIARIVPPDKLAELAEILAKLRRGERIDHHETSRITKDGRQLDVSNSISPLVDETGRVVGAAKIARDVTDRKRAEAGQRLLAEAGSVLSSSLDPEATLEALAHLAVGALADWVTVHLVQPHGMVWTAVAHADPAKAPLARALAERSLVNPDAMPAVATVLRTGRSAHYPVITTAMVDATTTDPEARAILADLGLCSGMVVPLIARGQTLGAMVFASTDGRRYTNQDLEVAMEVGRRAALAVDNGRLFAAAQASEARYRALFHGGAVGVTVVADDGNIIEADNVALRLLGRSLADLTRVRLSDGRVVLEGRVVWDALRQNGEWHGELTIVRPDGTEVPVDVHGRAVELPEGRVFLIQWLDASARKAAERFEDEFLAELAHDLNNPLTAARTQTQLLRRRLQRGPLPPARIEEGIATIEAGTQRMARRINELADVARLRLGGDLVLRRKAVDLVALVQDARMNHQQTTERHRLTIATEEPTLTGEWDGARLERVIDNLLSNAIKYSPAGGAVDIRVARETQEGAPWAVVSVCDHGVGIPEADLPHIFDRFRRGGNVVGRIEGSGIGLAGARRIVEFHGGEILVQSAEGLGTTVTVRLPLNHTIPAQGEGASVDRSG
jgi:PAS domain S-box-containing protein